MLQQIEDATHNLLRNQDTSNQRIKNIPSSARTRSSASMTKVYTRRAHHKRVEENCDSHLRFMHHQRSLRYGTAQKLSGLFLFFIMLPACFSSSFDQDQFLSRVKRFQEEEVSTTSLALETTTNAPTTSTSSTTIRPAKSKIPPVNFTEVEEIFNAVYPESLVVANWQSMDKQLIEGVRGLLKVVFPHVVSMASDAKVSGTCSGAILKWILNLRNMRTWAVKMLDATGKPSAGILAGQLTMFGNYKQCLEIRAPDEDEIELSDGEFREYFRGQYCKLQLKPYLPERPAFYSLNSTIDALLRKSYKYYEKNAYDELAELAMAFNFVNIRADLCVPSLCTRDDIQRVANFLVSKVGMRANVHRCEVESTSEQVNMDDSQLFWSIGVLILLTLVLLSTVTDFYLKFGDEGKSKSRTRALFTSMSIYKSLSHIRHVQLDRINDSKPAFLYTLRLIIVIWFCLSQLTRQLDFQYLRELLQLRSLIMLWPFQLIVNSSLQFDTLILLTAFTYSYSSINGNLKDLVKYNIAKYSRLMPSVMLLVSFTVISPILLRNSSPIWSDFLEKPAEVCKSTGFVNFLFLQNLLNYDQICLPHTWLLCVELQLCILTIPLVYWLNSNFDTNQGKFRLLSGPVLTLLAGIIAGCAINFINIYQNQLPGAWFETFPDQRDRSLYFSSHLQNSWAHLVPFGVGLLSGHLCRSQSIVSFSGKPYGRKCCDTVMWLSALLAMGALIFLTHTWSLSGRSHLDEPLMSALYGSLGPLVWSSSCALILFYLTVPDTKNERASLARLLTADLNLIRLARLSFLVYLVNPFVNTIVFALQEQPLFGSILMLNHTFIGNLVLSFVLAGIISALVELPCRRLIKKLALGSRRHCTNLGIITRQLHSRQQNSGPSRDSFTAQQHQQQQQQQQQQRQMPGLSMMKQPRPQQQQPMIPLK